MLLTDNHYPTTSTESAPVYQNK